ncbi:hypothetical protein MADA3029_410051 [Vibrio nigripulchritudo MADA3029]|uniref:hypothetical protein n=1 Tax=Vibrio nigripulchritudo TaxID=28173 RepID=UPI0003B17E0D|nr:hypothetical protein [Vibrio nigripulchritudo]CCN49654.1 hypothetical protein VIBNIMADA3020_770019 [Vibrio nigripulchritudo MADA3020]CCN52022.1 hypothetical protein VIBNIMADA3021_1200019 [Vibrio nigripulchritudo MADA3021]CCN59377.1 hypothetical protein MADA3029_410051 [Vibrio nigripulchritudo MADA3029]
MFLRRAWKGDIAVWQSVVFVSLVGYVLTMLTALAIGAVAMQFEFFTSSESILKTTQYTISSLLFIGFGIFTVRSLWTSANNPKGNIGHALARVWAICIGLYVFALIIRLIFLA